MLTPLFNIDSVNDGIYALSLFANDNNVFEVPVMANIGEPVMTSEIQNAILTFNPRFGNIYRNSHRKLTKRTLFAEFLWYMNGKPDANLVAPYLKNWLKYTNDEQGTVASNYGTYWKQGIKNVVKCLTNDIHSRRAVFNIYTATQFNLYKRDTPCTLNLSFNIRKNTLNMHCHMRSNDIWYGLPIDVFCNSLLFQMVYNELKLVYPDLILGTYMHQADSLHLYKDKVGFYETLGLLSRDNETPENLQFPGNITFDNFWNEVYQLGVFPEDMLYHFDPNLS